MKKVDDHILEILSKQINNIDEQIEFLRSAKDILIDKAGITKATYYNYLKKNKIITTTRNEVAQEVNLEPVI